MFNKSFGFNMLKSMFFLQLNQIKQKTFNSEGNGGTLIRKQKIDI